MNTVTLSGALAWILQICVLVVTGSITLLGTWCILNYFVWDVLIRASFRWLQIYKLFIHFIRYHKRYYAWVKKYEGKLEDGANN